MYRGKTLRFRVASYSSEHPASPAGGPSHLCVDDETRNVTGTDRERESASGASTNEMSPLGNSKFKSTFLLHCYSGPGRDGVVRTADEYRARCTITVFGYGALSTAPACTVQPCTRGAGSSFTGKIWIF